MALAPEQILAGQNPDAVPTDAVNPAASPLANVPGPTAYIPVERPVVEAVVNVDDAPVNVHVSAVYVLV